MEFFNDEYGEALFSVREECVYGWLMLSDNRSQMAGVTARSNIICAIMLPLRISKFF